MTLMSAGGRSAHDVLRRGAARRCCRAARQRPPQDSSQMAQQTRGNAGPCHAARRRRAGGGRAACREAARRRRGHEPLRRAAYERRLRWNISSCAPAHGRCAAARADAREFNALPRRAAVCCCPRTEMRARWSTARRRPRRCRGRSPRCEVCRKRRWQAGRRRGGAGRPRRRREDRRAPRCPHAMALRGPSSRVTSMANGKGSRTQGGAGCCTALKKATTFVAIGGQRAKDVAISTSVLFPTALAVAAAGSRGRRNWRVRGGNKDRSCAARQDRREGRIPAGAEVQNAAVLGKYRS